MKLKKFRVTNFRSVKDSGWIDCENVTALVGINEAGKTNIILALWKLNPAKNGEINFLNDMPIKDYAGFRNSPEKYTFISAVFEPDDALAEKLANLLSCSVSAVSAIVVSRNFKGEYSVEFPLISKTSGILTNALQKIMASEDAAQKQTENRTSAKAAGDAKATNDSKPLGYIKSLNTTDAVNSKEAMALVRGALPLFVYYSHYGNIDSQIYLPHAIQIVNGEQVPGMDNEAKARTLKVLFEFVKLSPSELYELGKSPELIMQKQISRKGNGVDERSEIIARREEREIMLQSASARLTSEFAEWWKQGEYKFRLHADGDYFRIMVSDSIRSEEVALELRSSGLQWFLSFFMVFRVESDNSHKDAILLLDEAGLTLHPMAQKDLISFFENLAESNQIIHTTHSPFLINTDHIDRVNVVYSDENGHTVVSSDLRTTADKLNEKSVYAAHAAFALSVADILLQGCEPIIVGEVSDQIYLNAIKTYLIRNQRIAPVTELAFVATDRNQGIPSVVSILSGKNRELPIVLVDSNKVGKEEKNNLQEGLYANEKEKVFEIGEFAGFDGSELEDLIPFSLMSRNLDRLLVNSVEEEFHPDEAKPLSPQVQAFAESHDLIIDTKWKIRLAESVRTTLLTGKVAVSEDKVEKWVNMFKCFIK